MNHTILLGDCVKYLSERVIEITPDLTFLDPPFSQNKDYNYHNDNLPDEKYWEMMTAVCNPYFD